MDIFANIDIEALREKLDSDLGLQKIKSEASKPTRRSPSSLEVMWKSSYGLYISIPESFLEGIGWTENTKLDMMLHDNVIILYPVNGFLNLRKIQGETGKSILISKAHFNDHEMMNEMIDGCMIWADDVVAYHRLVIQFSETIPNAFSH